MRKVVKLALGLILLATVITGSVSLAAKPGSGGGGHGCIGCCPKDIYCLDVWDPVICADGIEYSNQCYADRACAPKPCYPSGAQ